MPTIQNFALHAFDFPRTGNKEPSRFSFPAAVQDRPGKPRASETEISDNDLAEIQEHDAAKTWFGPDALVVKAEDKAAKAAKADAPVAESSPEHVEDKGSQGFGKKGGGK
jgi:hypothetical protein